MSLYKRPYLEPYKGKSTRHTCPVCKTKQSFTVYLDGNTGKPIHSVVGKCNREIKCGYHYTPRQYFIDHPELKHNQTKFQLSNNRSRQQITDKPCQNPSQISQIHHNLTRSNHPQKMNFIPYKYVEESVSYNSNFIQFLCHHFPIEKIEIAVENYALGATKKKDVIYWQIDINGKVRTGKIMQYNPETGRRVKNKSGAINWVHNKLKYSNPAYANFKLCQCYFGEHLLRLYPEKPVAIVEAEKTAVIGSMIFDNYNWLAAGNLNGLNSDKSKVLQDKYVVLYPDTGCYKRWKNKMIQIRNSINCQIAISNLIETHATPEQITAGYDLADYVLEQLKYKEPLKPQIAHNSDSPQITLFSPTLQQMINLNPSLLTLINEFKLEECYRSEY